MPSNLRPNPYKDIDPSDPQPQFAQDISYSQVLDRINNYDGILAPLFYQAPPPDPTRSFAIEATAQVAPRERQEHPNGATLLNPPLNNGWKFEKTAGWAKRGIEHTWEERRPGPPSSIPIGRITHISGGIFGVPTPTYNSNNNNIRDFPYQTEPKGKERDTEPDQDRMAPKHASWAEGDYPYDYEERYKGILPNFGEVMALKRQALEQRNLARGIPAISQGPSKSEQTASTSSKDGPNMSSQPSVAATSSISSTKPKRVRRQDPVSPGNARKRSKTEPPAKLDGASATLNSAKPTVAPQAKNIKTQPRKISELENVPKIPEGMKYKTDTRVNMGPHTNEKAPDTLSNLYDGIERRDSVMEPDNRTLTPLENQIQSKTTAHAMADYLRSIESRGTGPTKIEGWNGHRFPSAILQENKPASDEKGSKEKNLTGEEPSSGPQIELEVPQLLRLGGLGGMPFPDVFGTEGSGSSRGVGGVAGAVEAARVYRELKRIQDKMTG